MYEDYIRELRAQAASHERRAKTHSETAAVERVEADEMRAQAEATELVAAEFMAKAVGAKNAADLLEEEDARLDALERAAEARTEGPVYEVRMERCDG